MLVVIEPWFSLVRRCQSLLLAVKGGQTWESLGSCEEQSRDRVMLVVIEPWLSLVWRCQSLLLAVKGGQTWESLGSCEEQCRAMQIAAAMGGSIGCGRATSACGVECRATGAL
mmetsp:Transcript_99808/g.291225  ORF Transcript_99808/g.291225 Transcript_99808/m.291225 type:complete len:113 (-) Transcript_99808:245-583(-)